MEIHSFFNIEIILYITINFTNSSNIGPIIPLYIGVQVMFMLFTMNNNNDAENIPPIKEEIPINVKLIFTNLSLFLNQKINVPNKININKYINSI
jgi:hypothetical protein